MHQLVKLVSPDHQVRIYICQHVQQLQYSYARSFGTDILDGFDDGVLFKRALAALGFAHGVIAFSGLAKQAAQQPDG